MLLFVFFLVGAAMSVGAWFIPELGLTSRSIICGSTAATAFTAPSRLMSMTFLTPAGSYARVATSAPLTPALAIMMSICPNSFRIPSAAACRAAASVTSHG